MKLERILVPIDFSEMSREALVSADKLASEVGGSLTVLYIHELTEVRPVDYAYADMPESNAHLVAALEKQLDEWAAQAKTPKDRVTTKLVTGSAVDEIIDASKEHDIIVMRTHGRTGVSRFMLGSVAERVVRGAQCSVFILKHPPE